MAVWDSVAELTAAAQAKALDPHAWALRVAAALGSAGVTLPSPELARFLVSHVLWRNNVPAAWKYLEKAVSTNLVPPALIVALLSTRIIPSRRCAPVSYRLYMEILRRHSSSFASQILGTTCKEILISLDDTLCLSRNFGVQSNERGVLAVEFIVCIVWQLLDATLDDEGLLDLVPDRSSRWALSLQRNMEIEDHQLEEKVPELSDKLQKENTLMAIEIIVQFLHHKVISRLLSLAHQNMFYCMEDFVQRLHLLGAKSLALQNSILSPKMFIKCFPGDLKKSSNKYRSSQCRDFCGFFSGPLASPLGHYHGANSSAIWLPLDLYLEDCLDGSTVAATNAIKIISGLLKAIRSVNKTTWHDAFLALWFASLRLIQRERDPIEGPIPHIDTRMCILLPISTLSIADIINEEKSGVYPTKEINTFDLPKQKLTEKSCQEALITSLQMLGDFEALLVPPPSIVSLANQAAAKAMSFVSGLPVGGGSCESVDVDDIAMNCSGNLRHLIVESCIARNVVDTSAYYWPGYVNGHINQIPHNMPSRLHGWPSFMMGSSLTSSVVNILMNTPASRLAELEKIFEIAVHGSDGDRVFAASILCGASLARGWNIQEYTVCLVVKLLHPPAPVDYSGSMHHLISHGPVLSILLAGISSLDCVKIFSFHGLVPALAGALMEICEVFGSCSPGISWTLHTGEKVSPHTVFSNSFVLLLRLWKFNQTPVEHCMMGDVTAVGSQLTLEYLVLLHNSQFASSSCVTKKRNESNKILVSAALNAPIFLDLYPKLKVWYRQNQACLASTLSGLEPGTPVHQNVDILLNMMFRNINRGSNQSVGSAISASTGLSSSGSVSDDTAPRPNLPAWDILEAVPFMVDAALTACSHGRLSPRELATGLKDLADFLPASLGTMVSYFSSEVTRGVWKPVDMNGTDWPSPACNLSTVEENIKKIVAATGVHVPSLTKAVSSPVTLPLPLAAFTSLTITYKLDKASVKCLDLAGPALENLAASCPWPSMPIVTALWAHKVKRWSDFLSFSASRTVFIHNHTAVVQLLKSCFAAATGLSTNLASGDGGVGALLGHDFASHFSDGLSPVAPGILYLRIRRTIRDVIQLTGDILILLVATVHEVASDSLSKGNREELRKCRDGMKYGQLSLVTALERVKIAASLGATLVWLSGGSSSIQWLFLEMLPSWFLSKQHTTDQGYGRIVAMLEGYALAYFSILCGKFAWEINSTLVWKRMKKVMRAHMTFLADALEGKISLGCSLGTWRAYISGYLGLMVDCAPSWVSEVEPDLLRRVSIGLRRLDETELAILLLASGGIPSMGAAAEFIIGSAVE